MSTTAEGIRFHSTPSHGYFSLSDELFQDMQTRCPELLTKTTFYHGTNSFEEDAEWARIALAFPDLFDPEGVAAAHRSLMNYQPDIYEAHTGHKPTAEESSVIAEREFYAAHQDDYIVTCAWGSWHEDCPSNWVLVSALRGMTCSRDRGRQDLERGYFLVPEDIYQQRGPAGYAVDPNTDKPTWPEHL